MSTTARNFGQFLDEIRASRNISRDDFTDEIISIRQYQRYISGEASINNEKLLQLIDRLNMDFFEIYKLYSRKENDLYNKVVLVYNHINCDELLLAEKTLSEIDINQLDENASSSLYSFCEICIQKKTKKISEDMAMTKLKELIDYPNCLKNEIITLTELISLIDLAKYLIEKEGDKRIALFLFEKIKNHNFVSNALFSSYLPSVYSALSSILGYLKEYEKSIVIAKSGIKYCLDFDFLNSLAHLHYFLALSLLNSNRLEESLVVIRKMFALLSVEDKELKTRKFTSAFEKNFNMKVSDL